MNNNERMKNIEEFSTKKKELEDLGIKLAEDFTEYINLLANYGIAIKVGEGTVYSAWYNTTRNTIELSRR